MQTVPNNPYDEISIRRSFADRLVVYERPESAKGRFVAPPKKAYGAVRRRPDWLRLWYAQDGLEPEKAYQAENQSADAPEMRLRMLEYYGVLRRILNVKLEQFVFYYGHAPTKMSDSLSEPPVEYAYTLRDVRDIPAAYFIAIGTQDALLLAFLCGYDSSAEVHVRMILEKIFALRLSPLELHELLQDLDTLSNLRPLEQKIFRELMKKEYFLHYPELKETFFFQEGREEGREEGIEKGHIDAVLNMRRKKRASAEYIADALDFDLDWVKNVLKANDNGD